MKVDPNLQDALYAWAYNRRSELDVGFPRQSPFAKEYQAGYRQESRIPSEKEIAALRAVERGIAMLTKKRDDRQLVLIEYYGGFPGAPAKSQRIKRCQQLWGKSRFYRLLDGAHAYLEPFIDKEMVA